MAAGQPGVQPFARGSVEAGGRLIEQQHVGAMQPGTGQRQALLQAARKTAGAAAGAVGEAHLFEHFGDAARGVGDAIEPGVEVEVFFGGELVVERQLMAAKAEPALEVSG
jgi:hypothetical protein